MRTQDALKIVSDFKGKNLKQNLREIKTNLIGKGKSDIIDLNNVYEAALEVKRLSAQIDEIVHSTGIIKCLPYILSEDEKVIDLSLAAGADGDGIDLVTNKRIAEFKFSRWQSGVANGMRKRQVFSDLVNLYINPSTLRKELYVFGAAKIISFFESKRSTWKNVLSKSGGLDKKLESHLTKHGVSGIFLNDVYSISGVEVIDIDEIMNEQIINN
jgi:hypothetical protein